MTEIYKDIPEYEGLYQISNLGNVKSLDRYNVDKNGKTKFYPGRELIPDKIVRDHTTYLRVTLSKNGKTKRFGVHRLVALTFIYTNDQTLHVNHIDNNGLNNTVTNLEWCAHTENMLHAKKQCRLFNAQSKGGKLAGITMKLKAKERLESLVGIKSGLLEIIGYYGMSGTKHHVICKCHGCGNKYHIYPYSITSGKVKACNSCSRKKKI